MTRHESFKRQIRARMSKTGERYGAARRALIDKASPGQVRVWVAEPTSSDEKVREATGRGWDEWCDIIDAWPGHTQGHQAIATFLNEQQAIPGWWSQTVTLGYERITGIRLPNQSTDGTFSANKSKTVTVDTLLLRDMLLDEGDRADLFPGLETELRSRPGSKAIRIAVGPGLALFDLAPVEDGRVRVTVAHDRLPTAEDVEEWRDYWADWLSAIDGTGTDGTEDRA